MSIGNVKTYGSKWGTNYPWQFAMLKNASANVLKALGFTTVAAQQPYTIPALNGKTISLVVDKTNQLVLNPSQYSLAGSVFTLNYSPAGGEEIVITYQ